MPLKPDSPCHERWSELTPNGDGRYCLKCDKTVLDMSQLTRKQAEKLVVNAGGTLCGRLRVDPSGAPVFRPETARAPSLFGVATASLLAACGSTTESESSSASVTLASVEGESAGGDHLLDTELAAGSLATPMMPLPDDRDLAHEAERAATTAEPTVEATVVAAVVEDTGEVVPTEDQLEMTEHKEEGRRRRRHRYGTSGAGGGGIVPSSGTPATASTGTPGHRTNGPRAAAPAPAPTSAPSVNSPPMIYMGGISYMP